MNSFLSAHSPKILSLLRFITGFLFLWHGSQKLFNFPPTERGAAGDSFGIFTGVLEFFGGLLILIGLGTRWVAFILSGMMAVAYFIAHGNGTKPFLPILNGGELAVIYCFVFFYFFFAGGGPISVDALIGKAKISND
jgi:putative oxidoreductase